MDLDEAADAFALVGAGIVNGIALGELAGVNAEENEFADEGIAPEFEGEGAEFPVVIRNDFDGLGGVGVLSFGRRDVERAGEVVDDGINKVLDAFIFECGSAGDGDEFVGDGLATDGGLELLDGNGFFL